MYNLRAHILLCYGGACISSNAGSVKEAIEKAIVKAGLQNEVDVVTTGCMGTCELGPIMVIYPEGYSIRKLNQKMLKRLSRNTC